MVPLVQSKYYLIQEGRNWNDAQSYCRAEYTDLAIIRNTKHMMQLQHEINTQKFSSIAWIGLYVDTNSWRWSMGNEPLGTMRPWGKNQPNNAGGIQECTVVTPDGWVDFFCNSQFHFICFDGKKNLTFLCQYLPKMTKY
ncbi:MAG: lectin-like protein [Gammaproteobacteria bacterium]